MPELPDVQIYKEYFDATSLKKKIAEVIECDSQLLQGVSKMKLSRRLKGNSFSRTQRHGKYLFACLGEKSYLVLHFGMTGFLRSFRNRDKAPGHVRLLLRFEDGYYLAYDCKRKLGRISWAETVSEYISNQKLGPDALALCTDAGAFTEMVQDHKKGSIKGLLMNQKALAGIGNIYADEILFLAGLHPEKKAGSLDDKETRDLAKKTCHVLKTAIRKRAGADGWPQKWLLPRREEGKSCPRCPGKIRRIKVSGRSSYYCPKHQA